MFALNCLVDRLFDLRPETPRQTPGTAIMNGQSRMTQVSWRPVIWCLISAVTGGLFASALIGPGVAPQLQGQDRGSSAPVVRSGPRLPNPAAEGQLTPPNPNPLVGNSSLFLSDGMTPEEQVNVAVYERVNKSVANITTKTVKNDGLFLQESAAEGAGSGSVLDKAGHILTNFHVVEDARQVSVTLFDGKTYDAGFVGADPINDVAVIKIEAPPEILIPVQFGESSRLKVGMRVFAIGNPFGLERTLTTGVISSLNRSLQIRGDRTIKSIIQIDASINPGNSGGPLADSHGRLIGMNTAIASATGQSAGVGFAIPINLIARIVPQLIQKGKVIRPEIGISRVYQTEHGLLVAQLTAGGPAEKSGLKGPQTTKKRRGPFVFNQVDRNTADLIIEVDGKSIKTADDFLSIIESKNPGDSVILTVVREGKETRVSVRLGSSEVHDDHPIPGE
jgi:S1-C subfamily serine protease